jgi:hypothetical protein
MIRYAAAHMRVGVEDGQAIVNGALPSVAAPNLAFAGAMILAASPAADSAAPAEPSHRGPTSLEELIHARISQSFAQKSLEFAMRDLVTDVKESFPRLPFDFDVTIIGRDLQLNGITRNQQIANFDAQQKTVGEILTALVMRANPVTTVKDASELDQKLIWVIGPDPRDPNRKILLIATRDAADREGYKLPPPFQPK